MSSAANRSTNIEREVKLAAPEQFSIPDLNGAGVRAAPAEERRLDTVYWDTADLRLLRWGCSLRHRAGEGWTVKLPGEGTETMLARAEHTFAGPPKSPPAEALDLVRAYVRSATVKPVARMRTLRRAVPLVADDGERRAEIDDDEVTAYVGRRVVASFREIEVELVDGASDTLLDAIVQRLRTQGAGEPDPTPKLVRVLGDRARQPPEVVVEEVTRSAAAGEVVRRAIAASVVRLLRHDPGVRLGDDPEYVHQARVATRRLRSDLRTFASLVDPAWAGPVREELRWLAGELGAVRDAEVLRDRLRETATHLPPQDREAGQQVAARLEHDVARSRERLLTALREPRYVALLDQLVEAARDPALTPAAASPAGAVLPGLVARPWSRLRRDARRLGKRPGDEELHALRIRAKRCRYAAEAAAPAVGRSATAFARAITGLQDVLGTHHDAAVAATWLREHAGAGPEAFTAGLMWWLERAAAEEERRAWRSAWRAASARKLRTWM